MRERAPVADVESFDEMPGRARRSASFPRCRGIDIQVARVVGKGAQPIHLVTVTENSSDAEQASGGSVASPPSA